MLIVFHASRPDFHGRETTPRDSVILLNPSQTRLHIGKCDQHELACVVCFDAHRALRPTSHSLGAVPRREIDVLARGFVQVDDFRARSHAYRMLSVLRASRPSSRNTRTVLEGKDDHRLICS